MEGGGRNEEKEGGQGKGWVLKDAETLRFKHLLPLCEFSRLVSSDFIKSIILLLNTFYNTLDGHPFRTYRTVLLPSLGRFLPHARALNLPPPVLLAREEGEGKIE
jgi:hypothetical protein